MDGPRRYTRPQPLIWFDDDVWCGMSLLLGLNLFGLVFGRFLYLILIPTGTRWFLYCSIFFGTLCAVLGGWDGSGWVGGEWREGNECRLLLFQKMCLLSVCVSGLSDVLVCLG